MNRDVCEHFNPVDLPCEKCSVQKSTLREAAQQALEALEAADVDPHSSDAVYKAITALKAALAEPVQSAEANIGCLGMPVNTPVTPPQRPAEPVQEPVAWMIYTLDGKSVCVTDNPADFTAEHRALPLYTRSNT